MENINDYLYKYCLHDCKIDSIYFLNNSIILRVTSGVFVLDEKGRETIKTDDCSIKLEIDCLSEKQIPAHIDIIKICKNKIKDIEFEEFLNEVNSGTFDIEDSYISLFENSILLDGFISTNKYQFKISNIIKIDFDIVEKKTLY